MKKKTGGQKLLTGHSVRNLQASSFQFMGRFTHGELPVFKSRKGEGGLRLGFQISRPREFNHQKASSITKGQRGGNGQILATPSDTRSVDSQHRVEVSVPAGHGVLTMLCWHTQMKSRPVWIVFVKPLARQISRLSVGLLALCI